MIISIYGKEAKELCELKGLTFENPSATITATIRYKSVEGHTVVEVDIS